MKVLNLRCAQHHRFEGWFASGEDFESQTERGLMACPLCGDKTIMRLPSAPHLNTSGAREVMPASRQAEEPGSRDVALQSAWMQAVRHVLANTTDVGERFAEEARRIHYGETGERAIRGRTTADEATALREEGIDVMPLPLPAALKESLQ